MQMLGKNLNDLRKRQRKRRFTIGTVSRVGHQCVTALKSLHDIGYIHRDVKPSNMCVGLNEDKRMIYMIDFGMSRRFRFNNGIVRRERWYAGFRGTMRYVSVTVHERREQGPADDIWSLFYSMVEMIEGFLPWRDVTDGDEVALIKKNILFQELGKLVPQELSSIPSHLNTLRYNQLPDYSLLFDVLEASESFFETLVYSKILILCYS
ncbi:hypothetical protein AB6A40_002253 [Gnathostoma spinigerum]|uniref:non-specific serine/threonine protein kinase n=1 Tax=Gnathostoma spinigerum TaxID=75299 RepID=A0ABD6EDW3_9BILA